MYAHGPDAGMTGVTVVKPIVVIVDVIRSAFTLHAAEGAFTTVVETIVGYGYVL